MITQKELRKVYIAAGILELISDDTGMEPLRALANSLKEIGENNLTVEEKLIAEDQIVAIFANIIFERLGSPSTAAN